MTVAPSRMLTTMLALAAVAGCVTTRRGKAPAAVPATPLTPEGAAAWMAQTEAELLRLGIAAQRASWVKENFITEDTQQLEASANEAVMAYTLRRVVEARAYEKVPLSPELKRKFLLLRLSASLPAPPDPKKQAELSEIASKMAATYAQGKYCPERLKGKCLKLDDITEILKKSRNPDELLELWTGWHKISVPMRDMYARYVDLANEGAKELGFANVSDLWRARYDMTPAEFEAEVDRLWGQVEPLYRELHCFVRGKLVAKYGKKVPAEGPIPAHLLGNMWAQDWGSIRDLLGVKTAQRIDLDQAFKQKKIDEKGMVKMAEAFFVSLGLDPLPETFWQRSLFLRPQDREVECHASAWDVDADQDVRIKMCIKRNEDDFTTIHHELGHNYYQRAYRGLSPLFRDSANDGFHEGLGDTLALSVTPAYLVKRGLATTMPKDDIPVLLERALGKVAFLPFGVMMDKWRWEVFDGRVKPEAYNKRWWELRLKYQGVAPAVERTEADFDPGAKYHIPANVPYARYFLAAILQYQFHRALCKVAGHTGPLHTCSIYENRAAGERLAKMMEMGLSRPWPDALEAITGERAMDASAILDYYAPLMEWLKKQNEGKRCGW
jgi:peptidyl-dipeptidase A